MQYRIRPSHTNCVAKSYPDFLTAMQQLGANIERIS